jgi:hypothetical protein
MHLPFQFVKVISENSVSGSQIASRPGSLGPAQLFAQFIGNFLVCCI